MILKYKGLFFTTIIFFLIVNTAYYWEGKLGIFAIPALVILVIVYFGLVITVLRQIYFAFKERLADKKRVYLIGLITIVLMLTFFKPDGLINFDRFEGDNILLAEREGAANCMTSFKLKDDFTFKEKNVCFGVTEISGRYQIQNDTIYFDNVDLGRHKNEYYTFAVIKPTIFSNSKILSDLIRYKDLSDTIGHRLWITKNELQKLKGKNSNR